MGLRRNVLRVREPFHQCGVGDISQKQNFRSFAEHLATSGIVEEFFPKNDDATASFLKRYRPHEYYIAPPQDGDTASKFPRYKTTVLV
jgi:hypothetical protein